MIVQKIFRQEKIKLTFIQDETNLGSFELRDLALVKRSRSSLYVYAIKYFLRHE